MPACRDRAEGEFLPDQTRAEGPFGESPAITRAMYAMSRWWPSAASIIATIQLTAVANAAADHVVRRVVQWA
jgi:hypothetical protein